MPDSIMNIVNNLEYQKVRESIGSQRDVSRKLGVDIRTVQRREAEEIIITSEPPGRSSVSLRWSAFVSSSKGQGQRRQA